MAGPGSQDSFLRGWFLKNDIIDDVLGWFPGPGLWLQKGPVLVQDPMDAYLNLSSGPYSRFLCENAQYGPLLDPECFSESFFELPAVQKDSCKILPAPNTQWHEGSWPSLDEVLEASLNSEYGVRAGPNLNPGLVDPNEIYPGVFFKSIESGEVVESNDAYPRVIFKSIETNEAVRAGPEPLGEPEETEEDARLFELGEEGEEEKESTEEARAGPELEIESGESEEEASAGPSRGAKAPPPLPAPVPPAPALAPGPVAGPTSSARVPTILMEWRPQPMSTGRRGQPKPQHKWTSAEKEETKKSAREFDRLSKTGGFPAALSKKLKGNFFYHFLSEWMKSTGFDRDYAQVKNKWNRELRGEFQEEVPDFDERAPKKGGATRETKTSVRKNKKAEKEPEEPEEPEEDQPNPLKRRRDTDEDDDGAGPGPSKHVKFAAPLGPSFNNTSV